MPVKVKPIPTCEYCGVRIPLRGLCADCRRAVNRGMSAESCGRARDKRRRHLTPNQRELYDEIQNQGEERTLW